MLYYVMLERYLIKKKEIVQDVKFTAVSILNARLNAGVNVKRGSYSETRARVFRKTRALMHTVNLDARLYFC